MKKLALFIFGQFFISLAACAPIQPGNPAYNWLNGRWVSVYGTLENRLPGQLIQYVEADFRVENNNQVKGWISHHSASGRVSDGTISGVVGEEKDAVFVKGKIYWGGSGITTTFHLDRRSTGRLTGPLSQSGELPHDRFADLKKAK